MRNLLFQKISLYLVLLTVTFFAQAQKGQFLTADEYIDQIFDDNLPHQTLWVIKTQRTEIEQILDHSFKNIRIKYWGRGEQTAWIFEEIGKTLPIIVGVSVGPEGILDLSVLEYRSGRGGDVRHPFFTSRFKGVKLKFDGDEVRLDQNIDGLSGATFSVKALKRVAAMALYCHQLTPYGQKQKSE